MTMVGSAETVILKVIDIATSGSPTKTRVRSDDLAEFISSRTGS